MQLTSQLTDAEIFLAVSNSTCWAPQPRGHKNDKVEKTGIYGPTLERAIRRLTRKLNVVTRLKMSFHEAVGYVQMRVDHLRNRKLLKYVGDRLIAKLKKMTRTKTNDVVAISILPEPVEVDPMEAWRREKFPEAYAPCDPADEHRRATWGGFVPLAVAS